MTTEVSIKPSQTAARGRQAWMRKRQGIPSKTWTNVYEWQKRTFYFIDKKAFCALCVVLFTLTCLGHSEKFKKFDCCDFL